jgi:hypothetical protein
MLEACPKTLVQLHKGMITIFSYQTARMEVELALMEDKVKEKVAGLELQHMFMLCGNSAICTHMPNMTLFA